MADKEDTGIGKCEGCQEEGVEVVREYRWTGNIPVGYMTLCLKKCSYKAPSTESERGVTRPYFPTFYGSDR